MRYRTRGARASDAPEPSAKRGQLDRNDLPESVQGKQPTYRSITVDGEEIEFSGGFTDLHTDSYRSILAGDGFGLEEARLSIEMVSAIRNMDVTPQAGDAHPAVRKLLK